MNILKILETIHTGKAWKKIGVRHHHGINIPLASIWTINSLGIGEFLDLLPLIDYCSSLKLDILQLLPINDSGLDRSPYNILSSTALHPIYLSLRALPHIPQDLQQELLTLQQYNRSKKILYSQVLYKKMHWLHKYVEKNRAIIVKKKEYQDFIQNHTWLFDYSLFKVLKKCYHNQLFQKWPHEIKNLHKNTQLKLAQTHAKEIEFYSIVQYLCFVQLKIVKAHAEKKRVFLMGDIPILVSCDSVDVWTHRDFFDLSYVVGSPPNAFDSQGQVWSLPLYNWKALEKDHLKWWKRRIEVAKEYFHIYRLDHILGFFRFWAIPNGKRADHGHFIPHRPDLMKEQGRKFLKTLIAFSDMLPIGEDLGDSPHFVRECMQEYGIPGIRIFRYCRRWKTDRSFIPYEDYNPISLSSVSTHDLETVYLWWKNFPHDAANYAAFKKWPFSPKLSIQNQFDILWDNHHSNSLFHVNLFQEYLALVPELTWNNPDDERINIPGSKLRDNWRYRYKEPLDILLKHAKLQTLFQQLLQKK